MSLTREQRLRRGRVAPEALDLTPEEYFVLSRVEGLPTVGEVTAGSGLGAADTRRILDKLLELGAVEVTEAQPVRPTQPPPKPVDRVPVVRASVASLAERTRARRLRTLAAQLRPQQASDAEATDDDDETEEAATFERIRLDLIPANDARIDSDLAIGPEDQRWVLTLLDGEKTLTPFEFLGLAPTHDMRAIKRAFRETSRRLHPDSYFGKNLGAYRERLSSLFRRAKYYYQELRKEPVRTPYVDRHIEYKARLKRSAEEKEARVRAAEEQERLQAEAEAAQRRIARAEARAARERDRVKERRAAEAQKHAAEGKRAEEAGNMPAAANFYRMAMRADPHDPQLRAAWERCRDIARRARAADAFSKALQYDEMGQSAEASKLFIEAAEAHGTAEHLAHAAEAARLQDASKARNFAIAALDALRREQSEGKQRGRRELGGLHMMIARGFLAAGQKETAREQALIAQSHRPDDVEVRTLLKSIKVK